MGSSPPPTRPPSPRPPLQDELQRGSSPPPPLPPDEHQKGSSPRLKDEPEGGKCDDAYNAYDVV
uniref:Uncharacterized protein n=1 Tax=Fagus sylvatica TaxID=28930 RepID=A0A2N9IUY9_FAGSY